MSLRRLGISLLFGLCACLLLSCEESTPRTYEYFTLHPEAISKVYHQCRELGPTKAYRRTECVSVFRAAEFVQRKQDQLLHNPGAFGKRIMRAQRAYVNAAVAQHKSKKHLDEVESQTPKATVETIRNAQSAAIKATIKLENLQLHVRQLQAVVRVSE